MAPQLTEDEIDDLVYLARTGENEELTTFLGSLAEREKVSPAEILLSAKDEGKSTCLHMAAANGHVDTVNLLLSHFASSSAEQKKAFLDAANEYGNTGLHWAALNGHLPVVKQLVEAGASVALANDKNYVPLDLANFGDKKDVVEYFLRQAGLDPAKMNPNDEEDEEDAKKCGSLEEDKLSAGVEGVKLEEWEGESKDKEKTRTES